MGLVSGRGGSYLLVSGRDCVAVAQMIQWWQGECNPYCFGGQLCRGLCRALSLLLLHHSSMESLKRSVTFMVFRFSCDFALLPLSLFYGCCFSLHTLNKATAGNILFLIYRPHRLPDSVPLLHRTLL